MARQMILTLVATVVLIAVIVTIAGTINGTGGGAEATPGSSTPDLGAPPVADSPADTLEDAPADVGDARTTTAGDAAVTPTAADATAAASPTSVASPASEAPAYRITRVEVDGQDVADLMELPIWKFRFSVPNNQYTFYLWMERWTRGTTEPEEIRELTTELTGVWEGGEIVLKLPSDSDPRLYVRVVDTARRIPTADTIEPPTPWLREVLEDQVLTDPTAPINIMTYTYNVDGSPTGGISDVHEDHDITVYVKMRFAPGEYVPFDPEREVLLGL